MVDEELKEEIELNVHISRTSVPQGSNFRVREDSRVELNQKHGDD